MATAPVTPSTFKGKNIIVCCDGTGNKFIDLPDPDNSNSNVVKLYSTLRIYNGQVGYYHPGVGTADDPAAKTWIGRLWSRICGLAFARGFQDNVLDAYRYLMETYDDGDRVYLIGFSRGAYTARAVAGLLDVYGLLCKGNEGHLPYAWNDYIQKHKKRKKNKVQSQPTFKETFSHPNFRIHFLGIWDTVSSVGWINTPLRLYSVAQNPTVKTGRHAVSIDERRCFYRDNLWEQATAEQFKTVATEADPHPTQNLLQVWFPGVHSDVGGSYSQETSGLSNIALQWLIGEIAKADAEIKHHMTQLVLGEPVDPPVPYDPEESARIKKLEPLYPMPTQTCVHKSLKGIGWWLLELLPHRYYDKDDGGENWRTPLGMRRRLPSGTVRMPDGQVVQQTTYVHQTAKAWMDTGHYKPKNIIGGSASLIPHEVPGQTPGTICLYQPLNDPQPLANKVWFRWGVMIAITATEIAIVGAIAAGGVLGLRALLRH